MIWEQEEKQPIKVLIVEDSATVCLYLKRIFQNDKELDVVGLAKNGLEAVRMVDSLKPDVVTMDIEMPIMDGLQATRNIMKTNPVPIIIVSTHWDPKKVEKTFLALRAGAVATVQKPRGPGQEGALDDVTELIGTIKIMANVKVVRRFGHYEHHEKEAAEIFAPQKLPAQRRTDVVAFGASTGGPPVLQTILSSIRPDFELPILIVQHITPGFLEGMIDWLGKISKLPLHIPRHDEKMIGGHVYFAPDNVHMGLKRDGRIFLSNAKPENSVRPSVSFLFRSILESFPRTSLAVLLTGMGKDGAVELKFLRDNGAITVAQDQESSLIFGMPGEAKKLDAASYYMKPTDIARFVNSFIKPGVDHF